MEVARENSANLEQETKTTKIVTYPLFPLASSFSSFVIYSVYSWIHVAMLKLSSALSGTCISSINGEVISKKANCHETNSEGLQP